MADELTRQWGKLTLREDEKPSIVINNQTFSPLIQRGRSCMVGKLLTGRTITKEVLKTPMIRAWKPTGSVSFKTLGPNLFLIDFQYWWDKDRILEGRPWTFDGDLLSLVDFDGLTPIEDLEFSKAAFWVRMYKLPLACMGREVGLQVGATVGEVEDIDVLDDGVGWGEYLRVKIRLDLSKPLSRGRIIKVQDKELWVPFQYEKIPRFCFKCGVVMHNSQTCGSYGGRKTQRAEETEDYGPWLRVASPKRKRDQERGWARNGDKEPMQQHHSSGYSRDTRSWRGSAGDGGGGRRWTEGDAREGRAVKTKGEDRLFGPDRDLPNLESAESEMRDLGETKLGEGNTENQHLIQEEEDETTGEQ
jgi:hypothetical protein